MSRWLEAYASWPATNQMVFSLATLFIGAALVAGGGWLAIRLLGMHHARPVRPATVAVNKEIRQLLIQVLQKSPAETEMPLRQRLSNAGFDLLEEERALHHELQAEDSGKNSQNGRTAEVPHGHV